MTCIIALAPAIALALSFPQTRIELTLPDACLRPLWVEFARDYEERKTGLMHRETVAPFDGMLFDFGHEQIIHMWMKNTLIPLDMVFFDNNKKLVHIHYDAVPHSLDMISSGSASRYVLELPAGMVDEYGLVIGESFRFVE